MERVVIVSILLGILGGLVRGVVGIAKYFDKNKEGQKINIRYLVFSIAVAAFVGGVAGSLASGDWRLAIIAGYAGSDFIEGLYKIRKKQGFEI